MAVDPISIAVELAAGRAATSLSQRIAAALKRRACRRQLAANLWRAVVAQSDGRLRQEQGHFDPDALWTWMTSADVSAALLAADPAAIRQYGVTLRETWRAVTFDDTNALSIEDGQRAAELLFYLIVVDVLSGDGLVSTMASRILGAVESLHNDLALACETLLDASRPIATSVRKLALMSERAMEAAEQGLSRPGGSPTLVGRPSATDALQTALNNLQTGSVLLVTGQPDVGKSHLAMSLARRVEDERDVIAVDLRAHEGTLAAFEGALGVDLQEALTAMAANVPPLLVVDGAETVQTVGPDLLTAIVSRALHAGCQVLIVSRSDAELDIQHALAARGLPTQPHPVEGFSDDELAEVLRELPTTRPLAAVPMGAWVARRPGLLKAWLTLDSSLPIQNEGHLIELVRNRHIAYAGPGQASRLATANALARAELGDASVAPDPAAVDQLRSHGVLAHRRDSWRSRPSFSDDLWRDAALAGLIAEDPRALLDLQQIRSALRAARVACQLRINAEPSSVPELVTRFDQLAAHTGQARWGDIPFEAMSSFGGARELWATLLTMLADHGLLERFLATARRTEASLLHQAPTAMSGLIEAILDNCADAHEATAVIRSWLESCALRVPADEHDARRRVCAHLLDHPPRDRYEDRRLRLWLRDLALCASDLTTRAAETLRRTGIEAPERLDEIFVSFETGFALARSQPELLIELCDLYYIVRRGFSLEALRAPFRGVGSKRFDAFHTPLPWLLQVRPLEALTLANRILDEGCYARHDRWDDEPAPDPRTTLNLPERGPVELRGHERSWSWYRGGLAAPASAVNVLLAVERFADHLVTTGGTVDSVTSLLLRSAHNLPIVGLCVGLSIRHLDAEKPSDAFMCWVQQQLVWHLEIARVTDELAGFGYVSTNEVEHEERRTLSMGDIAPRLAAAAVLSCDEEARDRLEHAADALEASGRSDPIVAVWSSALRPSLTRTRTTDAGIEITIDTPHTVLDAVAAQQQEFAALDEPNNLAMRYHARSEHATPLSEIVVDIKRCQTAAASSVDWLAARTNTAAAALGAILDGQFDLPPADVHWAIEQILSFLDLASQMDDEANRRSTWSPALAVASVIPPLRRASLSNTASIDLTGVAPRAAATARRLAEFGGAEVTWRLLGENAPAWRLECSADERGDCPNLVAEELIALTTKRAVTRVGVIRRRAHRDDDESDPPSHYIEPSHLLAPLTLASGKINVCGHVDLSARLETALTLHAEAFDREPGNAPYTDGNHFARIGLVLMNLARAGATEWIGTYIRALPPTNQAAALQGLRQTAGDDHELRPHLAAIWPAVMKELEDGLTHDDRWVDVHAELVPSVRTDPYSLGSGDAWNEATANWIDPRSVESELRRWAERAAGCGKCAAALGSFMLSCDPPWLREAGLPLLNQLIATIDAAHLGDRAAAWLGDLPNDPRLAGELAGDQHLLAIIDRYVRADDSYARIARHQLERQ